MADDADLSLVRGWKAAPAPEAGGGDDDLALVRGFRSAAPAPEAPPARPSPPGVSGPRRISALSGPGARDPDAADTVEYGRHPVTGQTIGRLPTRGPGLPAKPGTRSRPADVMEEDWGAQALASGLVGSGVGRLVTSALGAAPGAAIVSGAAEGATASKVGGGDATTGALLGAALPAAGAAKRAIQKGAPARVAARQLGDLTENVRAKTANKVAKRAGEDGEVLERVIERNPDLSKPLATQAADQPGNTLKIVDKTLGKRNGFLDDAFDKMEAHHADAPAASQATVPQLLDDIDKLKAGNRGDLDKLRAIESARKAIVDAFGDAPGTVITPKELRKLKQSIGRAAFSGDPAAPATLKAEVSAALYKPIAKQLQGLAESTPGLDVKAFMAANEDVATLIPVRDALNEKAIKATGNRKGFVQRMKENAATQTGAAIGGLFGGIPGLVAGGAAGHVATKTVPRLIREVDYRLAQSARGGVAPAGPSAPAQLVAPAVAFPRAKQAEREYAGRFVENLRGGMSLEEAANAAGE